MIQQHLQCDAKWVEYCPHTTELFGSDFEKVLRSATYNYSVYMCKLLEYILNFSHFQSMVQKESWWNQNRMLLWMTQSRKDQFRCCKCGLLSGSTLSCSYRTYTLWIWPAEQPVCLTRLHNRLGQTLIHSVTSVRCMPAWRSIDLLQFDSIFV